MKVLFALFALFSIAYGASVQIGTAYLRGTTVDAGIRGTVKFTLLNSTHVEVEADISGISTDGERGIHIHTYGDISSTDGISAGAHWDPLATAHHGCPDSTNRHMGDMGNWTVSSGRITQSKTLDIITLTGSGSIVGRGVVLHGVADDCTTQPAGGTTPPRAAYGVIGLANPGTGNTNAALAPTGGAAVTSAICVLIATAVNGTNSVAGTVVLTQASSTAPTVIIARITGLDGKPHGFHIHEFGDVSNANGTAAGAHYNPLASEHGIPPYVTRHIGDMGNLYHYDGDDIAYYNYTNDRISLTGEYSVVGHTIIVHSAPDNCGQPTGNAGVRLAQCVIGVKNTATNAPTLDVNTPDTQDASLCEPENTDTNTSDDTSNFATPAQAVSMVLLAFAMVLAALF